MSQIICTCGVLTKGGRHTAVTLNIEPAENSRFGVIVSRANSTFSVQFRCIVRFQWCNCINAYNKPRTLAVSIPSGILSRVRAIVFAQSTSRQASFLPSSFAPAKRRRLASPVDKSITSLDKYVDVVSMRSAPVQKRPKRAPKPSIKEVMSVILTLGSRESELAVIHEYLIVNLFSPCFLAVTFS